jgi:aldose 1-epimerase
MIRNRQFEKAETFGNADGREVYLFTLTNTVGAEARIINYGGIVVSLKAPDRNGMFDDVVLGYETLDDYLNNNSACFGALIGRYANRIRRGRFTLNGEEYRLPTNDGENHIHGGVKGFDRVVWDAKPLTTEVGPALELKYLSCDGEEGYPGNLSVRVVYTLTNTNEFRIQYFAKSDKDTVINLTNHSFFNLAGADSGDILDHELLVNATQFSPTDAEQIPIGEVCSVSGTPFDFTRQTAIGSRINTDDEQLRFARGYDQTFVLEHQDGGLQQAAKVHEPSSGRVMEVWTTEPAVQFYSGNGLDGTVSGKNGKVYGRHYGLCLETQHFPDSPNHPTFPSTVLRKEERYSSVTSYKFSVE